MFPIELLYVLYVALSVTATILVARSLFVNGAVFLIEVFNGNTDLAGSVNRLLRTGFYLVNIGYIFMNVRVHQVDMSVAEGMVALLAKVGLIILVLGVWHLINMAILLRLRKRAVQSQRSIAQPTPISMR
ncbi:MAG: hypothetical protein MUC47_10610 [Candidatus Kapabacteria bacterium]|nr:hypothetical protein [Candidatus Kapabacteria bacterium]